MSIKLSNYFFLLTVICLTLSFCVKAQNSSVCGKGYTNEYVSYLEYESELEMQYNPAKDKYEYVPVSKWKMKWRWECVPVASDPKPANTNTPKSKPDTPNAPIGEFEKVWVDHNIYSGKIKGMRIHSKFNVQNLKGKKCSVSAYFCCISKESLKYHAEKEFTPLYTNSIFDDFKLFIPYSSLQTNPGQYSLNFMLFLSCEGTNFLDISQRYEFGADGLK